LGHQLRGVIVAAATHLNTEVGWSALTMARLAERVGVSRQTVYNEVGSKAHLAELIRQRATRQLEKIIDDAFVRHPTDAVGGVREAAREFLQAVQVDPMLQAILASSQGVPSDLLPSPAQDTSLMLRGARLSLRSNLDRYELHLTEDERAIFVESTIRLVLSKALHPSAPPEEAADGIAWVAARVLGLPT
jgi:AcrR family transcriptional regulator